MLFISDVYQGEWPGIEPEPVIDRRAAETARSFARFANERARFSQT
jgi:hypothetical protein